MKALIKLRKRHFELIYKRKDFDINGRSTAWDWAQKAGDAEEQSADW